MHEILRKRLLRKLEVLPEDQLYQVLDYIEFLESKYAREPAREPSGIQGFAERLEDRLRARSVVPSFMSGTMRMFGAAGRLVDEVSDAGRGVVEGVGSGLAEVTRPTPVGTRSRAGAGRRPDRAGSGPTSGSGGTGAPLVIPVDGPDSDRSSGVERSPESGSEGETDSPAGSTSRTTPAS